MASRTRTKPAAAATPRPFRITACDPVGPRVLRPLVEEAMQSVIPEAVVDPFPHYTYQVDIEFNYLEFHIARELEVGLDLDPEYQRAHVWTEAQQRAFVEYVMRGGETGLTIITGTIGDVEVRPDGSCGYAHYSLLDGKQRLAAVRKFLSDDLTVFPHSEKPDGYRYTEIARRHFRTFVRLQWRRITFTSYAEVLKHYLRVNSGGTPHTHDEIRAVRALLNAVQAEGTP